MELKLYQNNSELIVVNKEIEEIASLDVQLQENCSLLNPTFIINHVLHSNYCYVKDFARYYYITNITMLDFRRTMIECKVDVLMTYKQQLLATTQHIVRQESLFNMYLEDGNMQVLSKTTRQTKNLNEPSEGWQFTTDAETTDVCYVLNTL